MTKYYNIYDTDYFKLYKLDKNYFKEYLEEQGSVMKEDTYIITHNKCNFTILVQFDVYTQQEQRKIKLERILSD